MKKERGRELKERRQEGRHRHLHVHTLIRNRKGDYKHSILLPQQDRLLDDQ